MKVLRDAGVLLVVFIGGWAILAYTPWFKADDIKMSFPIETEEELGDVVLEYFYSEAQYQRIKDNAADSAIKLISNRLIDSLGLTDYDYNIILVESEQINAFTLPGGNIVVLSGLIEFAEGPEEVAAVLAHEMGHVEHRHTVDALIREFSISILLAIVGGNDNILIGDVVQSLISTSFSRSQEAEADEFALDLLYKSNVSPRALGSFFRKLNRKYGTMDDELEIFMTHPAKNSRIKSSMEYEIKSDFSPQGFDLDWAAIQASVAIPES